jgi:hypothetical protein
MISGIDFDDDEFPFHEENKSTIKVNFLPFILSSQLILLSKVENEAFYHKLTSSLNNGLVGTCAFALQEIARPDIKQTKSALMGTVLRLGDVDVRPEEAIEILVKASKCTALARPKSWKKFGRREKDDDEMEVDGELEEKSVFAQLKMRTEYYIDHSTQEGDEQEKMDVGSGDEGEENEKNIEKVEKEQLIRGFKYGSTYVPCPDGQFPRLSTRKGIDICGFFHAKNVSICLHSLVRSSQIHSFAGIWQWVRFSISGQTPVRHSSRSRSRPSYKPCSKNMYLRSRDGSQRTVWTRRWAYWHLACLRRSTVCCGYRFVSIPLSPSST